MKKLFLALLFSAVLFIGLPFYNINAMPITYDVPFSSVPDTLGLLEDILNGGKINIKDMTSIDDVLEHYKETVGAKNFLSRQANILASKLSKMAIDGELTINPNNNLVIPITISDLAYRMGYNPYWYEKYAGETTQYPQITERVTIGTFKDSNLPSNGITFTSIGFYENGFSAKLDRYASITYSGLKYPFLLHVLTEGSWQYFYVVGASLNPNDGYGFSNQYWLPLQSGITGATFTCNYPIFYNVDEAVNYSRSGILQEDSLIAAPDVIQVGDTLEWTYDVFFPKVEGLEGLSINQFLEWLQEQIDDSTVDFIDLGMLIADEVPLLVIDDDADADTTPTVAPIITTAPVIDIIDPTDDPANTPTPSPYPLPPIPKFDFDNIPNDVDHTVLAEIIDSTQQVIPDELMYLIWSTFGLLVVGGLIYILHK